MSSETNQIEFKTAVVEWLKLNEEISNIQKIIREKRKKYAHLGTLITAFMKDVNKEICNVGDSDAIVLKKSKTTGALKKEKVLEILNSCFSDSVRAQEVTETIFNSREVKEKDVLKKTAL